MYIYIYISFSLSIKKECGGSWRKTWAIERDPRTARNSALPRQPHTLAHPCSTPFWSCNRLLNERHGSPGTTPR